MEHHVLVHVQLQRELGGVRFSSCTTGQPWNTTLSANGVSIATNGPLHPYQGSASVALTATATAGCFSYTCSATQGIASTQLANGTVCNDTPCKYPGVCQNGSCSQGANMPSGVACPDTNVCHGHGTCDGSGTCTAGANLAAGSPCDDATVCDGRETCDGAGNCTAGPAPQVTNGDFCTQVTCDPTKGMQTSPVNNPPPSCNPSLLPGSSDATIAASLSDTAQFLYGPGGVQTGVNTGAMDLTRIAVIRGRVFQTDLRTAISGVPVSILGHPEFGQTTTRSDGWFDMAVNGGARYVVAIGPSGSYLPVQRSAATRWQDYTILDDVALTSKAGGVTFNVGASQSGAVYSGPLTSDSDGSRTPRLYVPSGTTANGGSLSSTLHMTEFTVGSSGANAMPADLPATSAYTYAVDFSVDGQSSVQFGNPVYFYLDDFVGFDANSPAPGAPMGSYDTSVGRWVASASGSGQVLQITVSGGTITGTTPVVTLVGNCAQDPYCEANVVGAAYGNGTHNVWRIPMSHFSAWDANWGAGPPVTAQVPKNPQPGPPQPPNDSCKQAGSIIECESQILAEQIPVVGTPFTLRYQSERTKGRVPYLDIPVTGSSVPSSLGTVYLDILVAGRRFEWTLPAQPNQSVRWVWDRTDAYGRYVSGRQIAHVEIGYRYNATYQQTSTFGYYGNGTQITGNRALGLVVLWQQYDAPVGDLDNAGLGFGGWSLSAEHVYQPSAEAFFGGDGRRRSTPVRAGQATTPVVYPLDHNNAPTSVATGADGTLYFAVKSRIYQLDRSGNMSVIAGNDAPRPADGPDGPALQSAMYPGAVAATRSDTCPNPSGPTALYFTDTYSAIRKLCPTATGWVVSTVAGNLNGTTGCVDGPLNTNTVNVDASGGIAVAPDGSVYVGDDNNAVVRRLTADGQLTRVAGICGNNGQAWTDGQPGTSQSLDAPKGVAADAHGNVYIAIQNAYHVAQLRTDGTIWNFAGIPSSMGYSGDGGPATSATMSAPQGVAVQDDGTVYIADSGTQGHLPTVRAVDPGGTIRTFAGYTSAPLTCQAMQQGSCTNGSGCWQCSGDLSPALLAPLAGPTAVAVDSGRNVFINDQPAFAIREVTPFFPYWPPSYNGSILVPSDRGDEIYVFDQQGRHQQTVDALQGGVVKYQLTYDPTSHQLTSIRDQFGNTTQINRSGSTVNIVSPYNQTTAIALDGNGYIATVTNPNGEQWQMTHTSSGLLTRLVDPDGAATHTHNFTYDALGQLTSDADPLGNAKTLQRKQSTPQAGDYTSIISTPLGRTTSYAVTRLPTDTGGTQRTVTLPSGLVVTRQETSGETFNTGLYNGEEVITTQLAGDPRFGMTMPYVSSTIEQIPSLSLTRTTTRTRSASWSNILTPSSQTDLVSVNNLSWTTAFTSSGDTLTTTSPLGRQSQMTRDAKTRTSQISFPGTSLALTSFTYDDTHNGRLSSTTQGSRTTSFGYYGQSTGFVSQVTDSAGGAINYARDGAGRPTSITLQDGTSTIGLGYDLDGNDTSVTPPLGNQHGLTYDGRDLLGTYAPPGGSTYATAYTYDADRFLATLVTNNDPAETLTFAPDVFGRPYSTAQPVATVTSKYDLARRLSSLSTTDNTTLAFTYGGPLLTSATWSGAVSGAVQYTYDNFFRTSTIQVTGGSKVTYGYDNDGLLSTINVNSATLTLGRDAASGLVTSANMSAGCLNETLGYDTYGALTDYSVKCGSNPLYTLHYDRSDGLGRVTKKTETIAGVTTATSYQYDTLQRLWKACVNDSTCSTPASDTVYGYDTDGNRTTVNGSVVGTYDAQDRMTAYGPATYQYTPRGDLFSKTIGGSTTNYSYDLLGNLRSVTGGGHTLAYVVDGADHRIAKQYDGTTVQELLYGQGLAPLAELNGSGGVVSVFAPGRFANVPELVVRNGITYRVVTDQLGSVRLVLDLNGSMYQRIDYDEYGNATVVYDSAQNSGMAPYILFQPFGFAGGIYDKYTGFVRFGARDYETSTGRWVTKDPIGFGGGINLYVYNRDDPQNSADPNGLSPVSHLPVCWLCWLTRVDEPEPHWSTRQPVPNPPRLPAPITPYRDPGDRGPTWEDIVRELCRELGNRAAEAAGNCGDDWETVAKAGDDAELQCLQDHGLNP